MRVNFRKVTEALNDIENRRSYYAGETLFIDFDFHPNVGLNLNGRGFSFKGPGPSQNFLMTKEMQRKVQEIYKKHKLDQGRGNQEYFNKHRIA